MDKEYKDYYELVEASNQFHNVVHDYINKYGYDDKLALTLESKQRWIELMKERHIEGKE